MTILSITIRFILISLLITSLALNTNSPCYGQEVPASTIRKAELRLEEENDRNNDEGNPNQLIDELTSLYANPIAINQIKANEILALPFLTRNQAIELMKYRETYGKILSFDELKLIPGFDSLSVQQLTQIITLDETNSTTPYLKRLFSDPKQKVELKWTQNLTPPVGYHPQEETLTNRYAGYYQAVSASRRLRYSLSSKGGLSIGFTAENDMGEPIDFKKNKTGFDFLSGYIQVTGTKIVRRLVAGDYSLSLGQGLVAWTGFAFQKGGFDDHVWRRTRTIKPYTSGDGNPFLRGGAIELGTNGLCLTLFGSSRSLDGVNYSHDTLNYPVISESGVGLHRTDSERAKKGIVNQLVYGGDLVYQIGAGSIGISALRTEYSTPSSPNPELYRLFSQTKQYNSNYSIHCLLIGKRVTLFGEAALSNHRGEALLFGVTILTPYDGSVNLVYRAYNRYYSAPLGNGFGENSNNNNEKGFFLGWTFKPQPKVKISLSTDIFKTDWISYRTDFPTHGSEQIIKILWQPQKNIGLALRLRCESKHQNSSSPSQEILAEPTSIRRSSISSHIDFRQSDNLYFTTRLEWKECRLSNKSKEGTSISQSISYCISTIWMTFTTMLFTSPSYEVRSSLSEPEIQGSFSIPGTVGEGFRNSLLVKWKNSNLNINAKLSYTHLHNYNAIIDSPDSYDTPNRISLTVQLIYKIFKRKQMRTDDLAKCRDEPFDPL